MGLFSKKDKKLEPSKKTKKGIDIELTEEDLDKAIGGIPFDAVDKEELMEQLKKAERKSWELTEEQLEAARAEKASDELSEEELDNVRAGSHEPDGR